MSGSRFLPHRQSKLGRHFRHSWLAAVLAAVALMVGLPAPAQAAPGDVVASFGLVASGDTTVMAGQTFTVRWEITTNAASSGTMVAPVVTVTIPDTYVTGVSASSVGSVTPAVTHPAGNYVVSYALSDLSSGQSYSVPIVIATKDGLTPDQATISVTAQVADSTGTVIEANDDDPIVLTMTNGSPTVRADVEGDMLLDTGNQIYGGRSDDNGMTLSSDLSKLSWVVFTYDAGWDPLNSVGYRDFDRIVFKDTFPTGASFDASKNPGWTLSTDGTYAEYVVTPSPGRSLDWSDAFETSQSLKLYLKFPGATTSGSLTNTATLIEEARDPAAGEKPYQATANVSFQLLVDWTPAGVLIKGGDTRGLIDARSARAVGTLYHIIVDNVASDIPMTFDVTDYSELSTYLPSNNVAGKNLDKRFAFSSLLFYTTNYYGPWPGPVEILTCHDSGPATLLKTLTAADLSPNANTLVSLPDSASITCVEVRGATGTTLAPEQSLRWDVNVALRDPAVAILTDNQPAYLYNTAYIAATWADSRTSLTGSSTGSVTVTPYAPRADTFHRVTRAGDLAGSNLDGATVLLGDTVTWYSDVDIFDATDGLTTLKNARYIDLLPPGFAYQPGTATIEYSQKVEPQIVNNYLGSGRQALIWSLGDYAVTRDYPDNALDELPVLYFSATVTGDVVEGPNINYVYLVWDSPDVLLVDNSLSTIDIYDMDGDGDTTERVVGASSVVVYAPPRSLLTNKLVEGSQDSVFLPAPQYGSTTVADGTASYLLRFNNNSIQDISYLTAIDALPYIGDQTLSPAAGDAATAARNSQFAVHLAGPVQPPDGRAGDFTITYTTDNLAGKTADQLVNGVAWTAKPSDWGAVTGFKITLNTGKIIAQDEVVEFTVDATLPAGDYSMVGQSAFNSFATSVSAAATNFFESGLAQVTLVCPANDAACSQPPPPPPASATTPPAPSKEAEPVIAPSGGTVLPGGPAAAGGLAVALLLAAGASLYEIRRRKVSVK